MTPTDDRAGPLTFEQRIRELVEAICEVAADTRDESRAHDYDHISGERWNKVYADYEAAVESTIASIVEAARQSPHASPAPTPADSRGHSQHPRAPGADRAPGPAGPGIGLGVDAAGGAGGRVVGGSAGRGAGDAEAAEDRAGGGAEAAGLTEAPAAPSCGYQGYEFGAGYLDSICVEGRLFDADNCDDEGGLYEPLEDIPCPMCHPRQAVAYWTRRNYGGETTALQARAMARSLVIDIRQNRGVTGPFPKGATP